MEPGQNWKVLESYDLLECNIRVTFQRVMLVYFQFECIEEMLSVKSVDSGESKVARCQSHVVKRIRRALAAQ